MKYLAVSGRPILHSKSPNIFSAWLRSLGIDAQYSRLQANDAASALAQFRDLDLCGMNVTAPFKETMLPLLDDVVPAVRSIGAVNTVLRDDSGKIRGYNTDHLAVVGALRQRGFHLAGKKCLVLGAGGAGRAAAFGLVNAGAVVTILNRTSERARQAAAVIGCQAAPLSALAGLLADADLLVSTLPGDASGQLPLIFKSNLWVFDADYRNAVAASAAEAKGCQVLRGEVWLTEQARAAFDLFFPEMKGASLPAPDIAAPVFERGKCANISLIGFMGSGKSAVGRLLAEKTGMDFVDCDAEIEKAAGRTIADIFKQDGEAGFRCRETEAVAVLTRSRGVVMACGGGAVLTPANVHVLRQNSLVVCLTVDPLVCRERLSNGSRPLLAAADPEAKARQLLAQRFPLYFSTADLLVNGEKAAKEVVHAISDEISPFIGH
jgi:shikimate dehydrogenase